MVVWRGGICVDKYLIKVKRVMEGRGKGDIRCFAEEEPPNIIVDTEPCVEEDGEDVCIDFVSVCLGVATALGLGLRTFGRRAEEEKGGDFAKVGYMELGLGVGFG